MPCDYSQPPYTQDDSMSCDYSQPPYTQEDSGDSTYHADLFRSTYDIMLDLESPQGLKKNQFWFYFQECEHCGHIAKMDIHACPVQENPLDEADEADEAAIGNGYEADAECSPDREGNMKSPVYGRKRIVIDLTLDDSD